MAPVMRIVKGRKFHAACLQLLSANPFQDSRRTALGTGGADSQSTTAQLRKSVSCCNHSESLRGAAQCLRDHPAPKLHVPTASLPGVCEVRFHGRPQLAAPGFRLRKRRTGNRKSLKPASLRCGRYLMQAATRPLASSVNKCQLCRSAAWTWRPSANNWSGSRLPHAARFFPSISVLRPAGCDGAKNPQPYLERARIDRGGRQQEIPPLHAASIQ